MANNAEWMGQHVPTNINMTFQQNVQVSITMRNTGDTDWDPSKGYKLGSENPQDNMTWGFNRVNLPGRIPKGGSCIFNFTIDSLSITPSHTSKPRVYNFQWRMLQEGVGWFGDYTPNVAITVVDPNV